MSVRKSYRGLSFLGYRGLSFFRGPPLNSCFCFWLPSKTTNTRGPKQDEPPIQSLNLGIKLPASHCSWDVELPVDAFVGFDSVRSVTRSEEGKGVHSRTLNKQQKQKQHITKPNGTPPISPSTFLSREVHCAETLPTAKSCFQGSSEGAA